MLTRLRHRAHGQEGFTLIELLVVILIIGILAAVAIPAFLSQKGKGQDANVKSDINSAQTAEESYSTNSTARGYTARRHHRCDHIAAARRRADAAGRLRRPRGRQGAHGRDQCDRYGLHDHARLITSTSLVRRSR